MMRRAAVALLVASLSLACASGGSTRQPADTSLAGTREAQGDSSRLVPAGYGTLRQEDIAIRISPRGYQVRAIPLEESIIRVLAPDSYRALRDLLDSRQDELARIASRYGVRRPSIWYVSFFGVEPEARFSPMELVITAAGLDHRPLDIVPLSPGFGQQRLRQRETQTALYVFEGSLDPEQPLVAALDGARSEAWAETLRRIDRERALIRSRAAARP